MTKRIITILTLCSVAMITLLFFLYATSPLGSEPYKGEFQRNLAESDIFKDIKTINLPYNSYYIAGGDSQNVYLGNWTNYKHVLSVNINSLDSQSREIKIETIQTFKKPKSFKLKILPPNFFLLNGSEPALLRGKTNTWVASKFMIDSAFFADAEPISKSSFALRSYSKINGSFELAKEKNTKPYFEYNYDLLQKQIDGMFCVNGHLIYNKEINKLIWVYTYRNQFIIIDTTLHAIKTGNTIDTFRIAPIKTVNIKSENATMLTGLPNSVNSLASASGNYLYIKSSVLGRNETLESFIEGNNIDIYEITSQKYISSIRLYYNGKQINNFQVISDKLFALYEKTLVIYDLNLQKITKPI